MATATRTKTKKSAPPITHLSLIPTGHALLSGNPADRHALHRTVMSIFPETLPGPANERRVTSNILYRVTPGGVIVQSNTAPSTPDPTIRHTTLDGLFATLTPGTPVRFAIDVNPVINTNMATQGSKTSRSRTYRRPVPDAEIPSWLAQRLDGALANVSSMVDSVEVLTLGGSPLRVATVTGFGTVEDPEALTALIVNGIGRGKAFGCGLLAVTPC